MNRTEKIFCTAKQACKKASLKIGEIVEAHHGFFVHIENITHRHDKLLSAAVSLCAASYLD